MRQFLTLVDDTAEEEQEESIDRLFSCLDQSSSESDSSSGAKKKKEKKGKHQVEKKERKPKDKKVIKVRCRDHPVKSFVYNKLWKPIVC